MVDRGRRPLQHGGDDEGRRKMIRVRLPAKTIFAYLSSRQDTSRRNQYCLKDTIFGFQHQLSDHNELNPTHN